jgi:hypothetical protein
MARAKKAMELARVLDEADMPRRAGIHELAHNCRPFIPEKVERSPQDRRDLADALLVREIGLEME